MRPYFYKIQHTPTKKIYVGCKFSRDADPSKLWVKYFTSSKEVKRLIKQDGIDSFKVIKIQEHISRTDAIEHEQEYLRRVFNWLGKEKFCEMFLNRTLSPGIILTPEIIEKANIKRKVSNSVAAKQRVENGTHNFQTMIRKPRTESHQKALIERLKGNKFGSTWVRDEQFRQGQAEKSKGNLNVRGKRWWFDGHKYRRSFDSPGEEFYLKYPENLTKNRK